MGLNYEANTEHWAKGALVIHDKDAKRDFMLMVVVGFGRDGLVQTRYVDADRHNGRIWRNPMAVLHDPRRFGIPLPGRG